MKTKQMNKLTKAQEKRFDDLVDAYGWTGDLAEDGKDKWFKQHLANELARQKKKCCCSA